MSTVSNMVHLDLVSRLADKKDLLNKALIPKNYKCSYCKRHVLSNTGRPELRLFRYESLIWYRILICDIRGGKLNYLFEKEIG